MNDTLTMTLLEVKDALKAAKEMEDKEEIKRLDALRATFSTYLVTNNNSVHIAAYDTYTAAMRRVDTLDNKYGACIHSVTIVRRNMERVAKLQPHIYYATN